MPTETARLEERKMIQTIVGRVSTVKILSKIKTNLHRCAHPEDSSSTRKSRAIANAITHEKRKVLGYSSTIPKSAEEINEKLPDRFHITSTGDACLRCCDYMDDHKSNLMMLFLSHHRAWVPRRSKEMFADSTLIQLQSHSPDLFFLGTKVSLNKSDSLSVQFAARQGDQHIHQDVVHYRLPGKVQGGAYLRWWCQILRRVS
jgi:hypothetical protein